MTKLNVVSICREHTGAHLSLYRIYFDGVIPSKLVKVLTVSSPKSSSNLDDLMSDLLSRVETFGRVRVQNINEFKGYLERCLEIP